MPKSSGGRIPMRNFTGWALLMGRGFPRVAHHITMEVGAMIVLGTSCGTLPRIRRDGQGLVMFEQGSFPRCATCLRLKDEPI